jgi:hypothetical protein
MKLRILPCALAALLSAGNAYAVQCAVDQVPAATLLIPYFEVDLEACDTGLTTNIWVRNVSQTHQLAQVTLWGEYGVPVAGFQIYLAPMAGRHIELADVLCRGLVPRTGSGVSPRSEFGANANPAFPQCNSGGNPEHGLPVTDQFPPAFLADVQARLTGNRSPFTNVCYGSDHGDLIARGYITVDDVDYCNALTHFDPQYLNDTIGFDNAFVGGYEFVHPAQNFAQGGAAIAIEAAEPGTYLPGDWTFYGRLNNFLGTDLREPLPATWTVPIENGGPNARQTDLIIWRETPLGNLNSSSCFGPPFFMPFTDFGQVVFDESGESSAPPVVFPGQVPPADEPFPLATQRVDAQRVDAETDFASNIFNGIAQLNLSYPPSGPAPRPYGQAWVGASMYSEGRFSDLAPGIALDSMCELSTVTAADVRGPLVENPNTRDFIFSNGMEP